MKEKSRILSKLMGLAVIACVMAMLFGMTTFAANKYTNMTAKKVYTNFDQDNSITHYYKIKVKSSGLLAFSGYGQYSTAYSTYTRGLTVKLCNSRGKRTGFHLCECLFRLLQFSILWGEQRDLYAEGANT